MGKFIGKIEIIDLEKMFGYGVEEMEMEDKGKGVEEERWI